MICIIHSNLNNLVRKLSIIFVEYLRITSDVVQIERQYEEKILCNQEIRCLMKRQTVEFRLE